MSLLSIRSFKNYFKIKKFKKRSQTKIKGLRRSVKEFQENLDVSKSRLDESLATEEMFLEENTFLMSKIDKLESQYVEKVNENIGQSLEIYRLREDNERLETIKNGLKVRIITLEPNIVSLKNQLQQATDQKFGIRSELNRYKELLDKLERKRKM